MKKLLMFIAFIAVIHASQQLSSLISGRWNAPLIMRILLQEAFNWG
jgi:uncharacterized integral membrane protein